MSNPTGDAINGNTTSPALIEAAIKLLRANGYRVFPAERVQLLTKFGAVQLDPPDHMAPDDFVRYHHDRLKREVGIDAAWRGALVEELAPTDAHARFSVSMMIVLPKPPETKVS